MKKITDAIIKCITVLTVTVICCAVVSAQKADVKVGGLSISSSEVVGSTTCVSFRAFIDAMTDGEAEIGWDPESETAYAEIDGMTISAKVGDPYIIANGRYIMCGSDNYALNGRVMTAVRALSKVFGASVKWFPGTCRVVIGSSTGYIESGDEFYDKNDLYWLSRIISAESKGEPLYGKLAVGAVIYNRTESEDYPNTVYDVIFDMKNGVQFTPAKTGSIYNDPTEESVVAAKICMEGYRYRDDILFFCTTEIRYKCWAGKNRTYIETIGGHAFFA